MPIAPSLWRSDCSSNSALSAEWGWPYRVAASILGNNWGMFDQTALNRNQHAGLQGRSLLIVLIHQHFLFIGIKEE